MSRQVVVDNKTASEALILELLDLSAENRRTVVARLPGGSATELNAAKFTKRNRRLMRPAVILICLTFDGVDYELRLSPEDFVNYVKLTLSLSNSDGQAYFTANGVPAEPSDFLRRQRGFGFLRDYTGRKELLVAKGRIC